MRSITSLKKAVDKLNIELGKWEQPPTVTVGVDKETEIPRVFISRWWPTIPVPKPPF